MHYVDKIQLLEETQVVLHMGIKVFVVRISLFIFWKNISNGSYIS